MEEAKKAIFIDGESLLFMRQALGIDQIRFRKLGTLLRTIGTCRTLSRPPLCTINCERKNQNLRRELLQAGFCLKAVTSFDESDDRLIKREIVGCKHRPDVGEIILVSCDGEIIDTLDWIRTVTPHIKNVIVVATLMPDPKNGLCRIRRDIRRMFQSKTMDFFELYNHRDLIGVRAQ